MSGFGATNPWPRRFGGGKRARTIEGAAVRDQLAKYRFDTSAGTVVAGEAKAYGNAIGGIWAINERLANSEIPTRMLETLVVYEEACRLRPASDDTDVERRAAVAAKLRATAGQATFGDIEDVCRAVMGSNFVQVNRIDPSDSHTYMPGGGGAAMAALSSSAYGTYSPGPPGYEWATARASIGVVLQQGGLDNATYTRLRGKLVQILGTLIPSYMRFQVGEGTGGFVVGVGVVNLTLL